MVCGLATCKLSSLESSILFASFELLLETLSLESVLCTSTTLSMPTLMFALTSSIGTSAGVFRML